MFLFSWWGLGEVVYEIRAMREDLIITLTRLSLVSCLLHIYQAEG